MLKIQKMRVCALLFLLVSLNEAKVSAQAPAGVAEEKGFLWYESMQGGYNSVINLTKLSTAVGYKFNRFVSVDAGIPVYFVRSSTTTLTSGTQSTNGIGNLFLDLRLRLDNPVVYFTSTLTGTVPTGDTSRGLSTGHVTYDWDNHFGRSFGRFTPFLDAGVSNTISDTHFLERPFTSLGFVGHFEAGADYKAWRSVYVGASGYSIVPVGQQKLFSRVVTRGVVTPTAPPDDRFFETNGETIGSADIDRDRGFSAWINVSPARFSNLELGYTRSIRFALDTVSLTVGFDLASLVRKARNHRTLVSPRTE